MIDHNAIYAIAEAGNMRQYFASLSLDERKEERPMFTYAIVGYGCFG